MLLGVMLPDDAALCLWRKPAICLIKDDLGLETVSVYGVPWEHGWYYIGQAGPCIEMWLKEYQWDTCLSQPVILTVAKQSFNTEYCIDPKDVKVLSPPKPDTWTRLSDRLLSPSSIPATWTYVMTCLEQSWKPPIQCLKEQRRPIY
jgi:hypothetical protein